MGKQSKKQRRAIEYRAKTLANTRGTAEGNTVGQPKESQREYSRKAEGIPEDTHRNTIGKPEEIHMETIGNN